MKLEIAMTERDKKLLVFLGIFVVVVCFGYWGIRPSIQKIQEMDKQITKYKSQREKMDLKIAELPMLEMENEELEEDIVKARENYFPMMTSDEVDRYFTDMALSYHLYSCDLSIEMPSTYCELLPYQYSEKALNGPVEEVIETDPVTEIMEEEESSADAEDEEEEDENPAMFEETEVSHGVYGVKVEMRLTGEPADLANLVNTLSHSEERLRVMRYSYSTKRRMEISETGNYDVVEDKLLDISVEIYMCEE